MDQPLFFKKKEFSLLLPKRSTILDSVCCCTNRNAHSVVPFLWSTSHIFLGPQNPSCNLKLITPSSTSYRASRGLARVPRFKEPTKVVQALGLSEPVCLSTEVKLSARRRRRRGYQIRVCEPSTVIF